MFLNLLFKPQKPELASLSLAQSQQLEYFCFHPANLRQTASFSWQAAPTLLDFQSDSSLL